MTALLVAVLVAAVAITLRPPEPRVSRADMEKVREGMSLEDVTATVGGPPGDYSTRRCVGPSWFPNSAAYQVWTCDSGELLVRFDERGKAAHVLVSDVAHLSSPSLAQRVQGWLGL